ncbi:hypothetical protein GCM10027436_24410 [Actinophytocola sediminis]
MSDEMIVKQPLPTVRLQQFDDLALRAAEKGGNPVLAEIARDVRAGRLTLREAAASSAYHDTFAEGAAKAMTSLRELGPIEDGDDERSLEQRLDDLVAGLSEWEREIVEQPGPTDTPAPEPTPTATDDSYFDGTSLMVGPEVYRTGTPAHRTRWNRRW